MSFPTTSIDDPLVADIAPAMLAKLERDGRSKGSLIASASVVVAIALEQNLREVSRSSHGVAWAIWGMSALAAAAVALAVLPPYLKKKSVLTELDFRRQHGKWRWDR
jgi:hypothetical protein